jgi:hypothetical protein
MPRARTVRRTGTVCGILVAIGMLAAPSASSAQVPCSGNAGGLNERRFNVMPLDITAGPAQVTRIAFENGAVVLTQQVEVIVELQQQTHRVSLCLHADYAATGTARAIATGDLEWRRVSPDAMASFVPVSRNTPVPVITEQAVGSVTAVYEFRMRLRWESHPPGTWMSGIFWTAYRNNQ